MRSVRGISLHDQVNLSKYIHFKLSGETLKGKRNDWAFEGGGSIYRMWSWCRRKWRDAPDGSQDEDLQEIKNLFRPAKEEWPSYTGLQGAAMPLKAPVEQPVVEEWVKLHIPQAVHTQEVIDISSQEDTQPVPKPATRIRRRSKFTEPVAHAAYEDTVALAKQTAAITPQENGDAPACKGQKGKGKRKGKAKRTKKPMKTKKPSWVSSGGGGVGQAAPRHLPVEVEEWVKLHMEHTQGVPREAFPQAVPKGRKSYTLRGATGADAKAASIEVLFMDKAFMIKHGINELPASQKPRVRFDEHGSSEETWENF